jgi:hypothetical protein
VGSVFLGSSSGVVGVVLGGAGGPTWPVKKLSRLPFILHRSHKKKELEKKKDRNLRRCKKSMIKRDMYTQLGHLSLPVFFHQFLERPFVLFPVFLLLYIRLLSSGSILFDQQLRLCIRVGLQNRS